MTGSTRRRFDTVICDIDGCLCPETSEPFDWPRLGQLARYNQRAQDQGDRPVLTLCSGRPVPFVEATARLVGNRTMPAVGENGVWLWFPDDGHFECDSRIGPENLHDVQQASSWVTAQLEPLGFMQQPGKRCSMSLYHPDLALLAATAERLPEQFAAQGWSLRVSRTWYWINCDLAHISKATGVQRLLDRAGVERSRTVGIGDTLGDMGIREQVEWFACPSNAAAELKRHADYVSDQPEVAGVIDILEHLPRG